MDYQELIFKIARSNGMPVSLANFIVGQARHETADFTSSVFKSCNNAFGYKYVGQSDPVSFCRQAPEGGGYAFYPSVADSVNELTSWIRRRQREGKFPSDLTSITTPEKYAELLKAAAYYGDPVSVYAAGLRKFASNYGALIGFGGLLVISAIAFFLFRSKGSR